MQEGITFDCATHHPLLLVHGAGFSDRKRRHYWGRIPTALAARGARLFYGGQDAWGSIEGNAQGLADKIEQILHETGGEKVNILAHSKGGLEARYLACTLGYAGKIASITTIATPHHGSKTMDGLCRAPKALFHIAAFFVNGWCRLMGDAKPDFHKAARQLSAAAMQEFNTQNPDMPGVYIQSYATAMARPRSDMFMWLPSFVVGRVEGENDGLVSTQSARWAHFGGIWRGSTNRGISHLDSVDFRRRPLCRHPKGTGVDDIPTAYVELVQKLVEMGL